MVGDRQPKYLRIHGDLRDRIISGQWSPGTPLAPQHELAGQYGVSMMTLRQALQLLIDDGLVETRQGSGTYITARYEYDLGHLSSFASDLSGQGVQVSTEVLAAYAVEPPADIAARLGAATGVLRLRRLRLADGRPLIVQTSYLPAELASVIEPESLNDRGLYTALSELGLTITRANETISATTLSRDDARDLRRPESSPALLSHRISFTQTGVPIVDDYALLAADSVVITANRSPQRLDVHYSLTGQQVAPA